MLFPRARCFGIWIAALAVSGGPAWAEEPKPDEAKVPPRQTLLEKPVELPGNKLTTRVVRVALPQGYKTPLHTHEGPGPRYVLRGRVKVEEGGQVHEYGPGEVFWESGQWTTAENVGQGEVELLIVELAAVK
ncbi:cupin domain-containing protein [Methylomagnum ishizawai]|uniref:cupin domain-containing protein n=1 Tax=Methylomagnum ishizawai TaxID=1760988 RepID=UPI001C807499|nr:cupin domain-containing protein [Methylomagnum ishizawai]